MNNELELKKCLKCGALVKVLKDCDCDDCGIKCCGEQMKKIVPNTVDASFEKHIPTYEVSGDYINVKVNHVMEEEHYIEWIAMLANGEEYVKYLKPGEVAEAKFKYVPGANLYAYCNKHELWKAEVK